MTYIRVADLRVAYLLLVRYMIMSIRVERIIRAVNILVAHLRVVQIRVVQIRVAQIRAAHSSQVTDPRETTLEFVNGSR